MSKIYDLPLIDQKQNWHCWIIAPTILACKDDSDKNYQELLGKHRKLLGNSYYGTFETSGEGLDPTLIKQTYEKIGVVPLEITLFSALKFLDSDDYKKNGYKSLNVLEQADKFADQFEEILNRYGPVMFIRKAIGFDAIHAEPIVGILKINETDKVRLIYNDSMEKKEKYYNLEDFRELIENYKATEIVPYCCCFSKEKAIPSFWVRTANENHIKEIATKNLSQYDCRDLKSQTEFEITTEFKKN